MPGPPTDKDPTHLNLDTMSSSGITEATTLIAGNLTMVGAGGPFAPAAGLPAGAIIGTARYAPNPPPFYFYDALTGATAVDVTDYKFYRNAAFVGGAHGFVNNALRIQNDVGAGVTSFEWSFIAILNNAATDTTAENVAITAQANRNASPGAGTWGMLSQATDTTGVANPVGSLIGLEIDIAATGTDTGVQRVGIDIVGGTQSGAAAHIGIGLRVNAGGTAQIDTGIVIKNIAAVALEIQPTAATIGINLVNGTFSTAAIRLARQQIITLEASNTIDMQSIGAADTIVKFRNATVEKVGLDINTLGLRISAVQVVTARQTGYTNAWTGTLERAIARDQSTVTLAQLAQRVAAIQTDLVTHGLLGP
jgi:hypothetical protein